MNSICLDVCAELAGFADFATLAGVSGSLGALSSNAFGLANTPFGTALGVPAALIPSNYDCNFITFRLKRCRSICRFRFSYGVF